MLYKYLFTYKKSLRQFFLTTQAILLHFQNMFVYAHAEDSGYRHDRKNFKTYQKGAIKHL